jgi:hypothetical protein
MNFKNLTLLAIALAICLGGAAALRAASAQSELRLRVFSTFVDDEDREMLAGKKGPWIAYTESRVLFTLSDGKEYGHGVPYLMICHTESRRKLMIACEAFLGADFKVTELTQDRIAFEVIDGATGKVLGSARYNLHFPNDLKAPFVEGVGVEVLDPNPPPE